MCSGQIQSGRRYSSKTEVTTVVFVVCFQKPNIITFIFVIFNTWVNPSETGDANYKHNVVHLFKINN